MRELTKASAAYTSIAGLNRDVIITSGLVTPTRMLSTPLQQSVSACSFM
jgi:hypothetical protein